MNGIRNREGESERSPLSKVTEKGSSISEARLLRASVAEIFRVILLNYNKSIINFLFEISIIITKAPRQWILNFELLKDYTIF